MSLVNDMLRDLAHQHQGEPQARCDGDTLLAESSLLKKSRHSWLPSVVVFAVVLVGLLWGQKVFLNQVEKSSETTAAAITKSTGSAGHSLAAAPEYLSNANKNLSDQNETIKINNSGDALDTSVNPAAQQTPLSVQMSAQMPTQISPESAIVVTDKDPVVDTALVVKKAAAIENITILDSKAVLESNEVLENNEVLKNTAELERVYTLLQSAERAMGLDRLTSPIEDNAYRYYQEVLQLAPQNSFARAGLQTIAQRYVDLATEAFAQANRQRAETLLERAEFVVPGYAAIALVRQKMTEMTATATLINHPTAELPSQLQVENKHKASAPSVNPSASVAISSFAVAEANAGKTSMLNDGSSGITRNAAWQDQQAATQAEQLVSQDQTQAAQLFLQEFIAGHQQPIKATQVLFKLYLQQPDQDAARLLLQEARSYLPELLQTHLTAQLLLAQGSPAAAISVLEKDIQQAENDEAYRALLAGLYHKTARYHESASSYRRLLDVFGEKPAYWLGLALALDALQQNASALEAYRRIPLGDALPVQVKDYVDRRILALSH